MKKTISIFLMVLTLKLSAAVPTEEGLLRNLNNNPIPGSQITIKAAIKKIDETKDNNRVDYYKFVLVTDGPTISLFQVNYNGSQMLNNQIQDLKLIQDLVGAIKKDKTPERGMFYGALSMLATNRSTGMISFIEKTGGNVTLNRSLLNEDKLKLLKTYHNYLATTKGKGEASSPLNPQDPTEKAKVLDLFKSNTYQRSQNISLVKENNEFLWLADWKSVKGYFTNEERRLRTITFQQGEVLYRLDASDYALLNNNNEFPKNIVVKDEHGVQYKIQILGFDVKKTLEKKLNDRFVEAQKSMGKNIDQGELFEFLF